MTLWRRMNRTDRMTILSAIAAAGIWIYYRGRTYMS